MNISSDSKILTHINEWDKKAFEEILIVGNGDGILDAPVGIFWDDRYFKIGINRAYMLGMMDCCMSMDKLHLLECSHDWGGNTIFIHPRSKLQGSQLPLHYQNSLDKFKENLNENRPVLYRRKNSLFPCLDLACRLSKKEKPITMIGVSFMRKWHFYKNKFNQERSEKEKVFLNSDEDKGTELINFINLIMDEGYDIRYTDTSDVLVKTKAQKITYLDLKYSRE
mgnify:CR=1 FL=1